MFGLNVAQQNDFNADTSDLASGAGLYSGIEHGGVTGDTSAALSASKLASASGLLKGAANSDLSAISNYGAGALGLYQGIEAGGVAGGAETAVSGARLAATAGAATGLLSSGTASMISGVAGDLAAPLALYEFVQNYQSGNTSQDTMQGAEAGAAIGSVIPVVGTAIGAVVGAAVGAISSAFGGGEKDPETQSLDQIAPQLSANPHLASQLTGAQTYQMLAGLMDAKNNSAGHSTQLELAFGRFGEQNLLTQMTGEINSAIGSGKISSSASPTQIYQQVVVPWLQSKNAYVPPTQVITSQGTKNGGTVDALLTNLIGDWQSGGLTSQTPIGISGQTDPQLQAMRHSAPAAASPAQSVQNPTTAARSAPNAANSAQVTPMRTNSALQTPQAIAPAPSVAPSTTTQLPSSNPYVTNSSPLSAVSTPSTTLPSGSGTSLGTEAGIVGAGLGANALGVPNAAALTTGALGLYQTSAAANQNAQTTQALENLGAPLTAAGGELMNAGLSGSLTPAQQNVVSTLNSQGQTLINSASPLASIANTAFANYQAGQLQPGQQQQIDAWTTSQKQQLQQMLSQNGIEDSSVMASQEAAIDSQATQLKANLMAQNLNLGDQQYAQWLSSTTQGQQLQAQAAQYSVQSVNTDLSEALGFSQAGMAPVEDAVKVSMAQDAALSSQTSSLFQNLANALVQAAGANGSASNGQAPLSGGTLASDISNILHGVSTIGSSQNEGTTNANNALTSIDQSTNSDLGSGISSFGTANSNSLNSSLNSQSNALGSQINNELSSDQSNLNASSGWSDPGLASVDTSSFQSDFFDPNTYSMPDINFTDSGGN